PDHERVVGLNRAVAVPEQGAAGQRVIFDRPVRGRADYPADQIPPRARGDRTEIIAHEDGIFGVERGLCVDRKLNIEVGLFTDVFRRDVLAPGTNPVKPYFYRFIRGAGGAVWA